MKPWCIALSALLGSLLCCGCELEAQELAVGTLERDRIELVADSSEPIVEIRVTEGARVGPGDVILRQQLTRPEALLAGALARQDVALARLAEAEKGPRAQSVAQGRARFAAARSAVVTANHELDREISLVARSYSSQSRVDILQGKHDEAVARREETEAGLDELLEGSRSETIDQARSEYAAAVARVVGLEISVARATIRSPVSGVVEVLPFEIGERPSTGQVVGVVLAHTPTYARVHIPEPMRTRLRSAMAAEIRIDGYSEPFLGRIRWIARDAAFTPYYALTQHDRSRLSYLAEIDLQDSRAVDLPAGIPVEVRFPQLGAIQP
jgi:HlyD family secretion protein